MIRKTIAEVVMTKSPDNPARISMIDGLAKSLQSKGSSYIKPISKFKDKAEQLLTENPNFKKGEKTKSKKYKRYYA